MSIDISDCSGVADTIIHPDRHNITISNPKYFNAFMSISPFSFCFKILRSHCYLPFTVITRGYYTIIVIRHSYTAQDGYSIADIGSRRRIEN